MRMKARIACARLARASLVMFRSRAVHLELHDPTQPRQGDLDVEVALVVLVLQGDAMMHGPGDVVDDLLYAWHRPRGLRASSMLHSILRIAGVFGAPVNYFLARFIFRICSRFTTSIFIWSQIPQKNLESTTTHVSGC